MHPSNEHTSPHEITLHQKPTLRGQVATQSELIAVWQTTTSNNPTLAIHITALLIINCEDVEWTTSLRDHIATQDELIDLWTTIIFKRPDLAAHITAILRLNCEKAVVPNQRDRILQEIDTSIASARKRAAAVIKRGKFL